MNATTVGSGVVNSSLTTTGTLTSLTVSGVTELQSRVGIASATESLGVQGGTSGSQNYDLNSSAVFYHNSVTGDISVNFQNVPTTASKTYTIAVILNQGGTGYVLTNNITINGGSSTAIIWQGGNPPSANANKRDIFTINLLNISATATPSWLVFGSMQSFG